MFSTKITDESVNDINVSHQNQLPADSVSSIVWMPYDNYRLFATASWDSKIRIYEPLVDKFNSNKVNLELHGGFEVEDPCLSIAWCEDDPTKLFGGCVNGTVKAFDISSGKYASIGAHQGSVKDVYWLPKANVLLSLSFDKTINFWDLRQEEPAATLALGYKAFCSDLLLPYLAVGMSDEKLALIDLNNLQALQNKSVDIYESPLGTGSTLTTVAFSSDGAGIAVGAHDGRANVSKFTTDIVGNLKLSPVVTFRTKKYANYIPVSKQVMYPVHDIGFSPLHNDFVFTAGGEGTINFWDFNRRDKIKSYNFDGAPVTRTKMSPDGLLMAYALGYDWLSGIGGQFSAKTKVCVHVMQKEDLAGK